MRSSGSPGASCVAITYKPCAGRLVALPRDSWQVALSMWHSPPSDVLELMQVSSPASVAAMTNAAAEANADADSKRKEGIEVKNEIDSTVYSTEKSLSEHADKITDDVKSEVEEAIKVANEAKEGDDVDAVKSARDALNAATSKIGQAIYGSGSKEEGGEEKKEETVDAEFEEKKEEEKK